MPEKKLPNKTQKKAESTSKPAATPANQQTQTQVSASASAPAAAQAASAQPKQSNKVSIPAIQTVRVQQKSGTVYFGGVSPIDVALSVRHLSIMLKSGLPLEGAIKVLGEQSTDARLGKAYADVLLRIQNGQTLADSMRQHPKIFSQVMVAIIDIGEQGGTLEKNLVFLSEFLKKQYELQRKVKGALVYPMIVMGLTMIEMLGVIFFILPKLDALFSSFDDVPSFTKFVLNFSKFVRENSIIIGITILLSIIGSRQYLKTKGGKRFRNKVSLNFPIIKKLYKSSLLTTFSRTLGILLESGMPISKALGIAASTIGDETYEKAIKMINAEVSSGKNLAGAMARYPQLFPPTYIKIIEVGESTATLEESLHHMYEFYEEEVNDMANNLTTLLEPILLIFIGLMIGSLAVLIIAPIYQLTGSLN